jgi:hypothetical protein
LVDDVLFNIVVEKTTIGLWMKLESHVYDEILDEHDLAEKTIVQFVHEGRYKNS